MTTLKSIMVVVNRSNDRIGKIISFCVFPLMFIMLLEVVARYAFNRPTIWAHEVAGMIYAIYFLMGGAYTLRWDAHVKVEIFYVRLHPRARAIIDLVSWSCFYLFCGVLLLKGTEYAWDATLNMEYSNSAWGPPIWPIKLFIPLSAFLMLVQGITKTLADFILAITGQDLLDNPK